MDPLNIFKRFAPSILGILILVLMWLEIINAEVGFWSFLVLLVVMSVYRFFFRTKSVIQKISSLNEEERSMVRKVENIGEVTPEKFEELMEN